MKSSAPVTKNWGTAEVEFTFMKADPDGQVVQIRFLITQSCGRPSPSGISGAKLGGVDGRTIPLVLLKAGKSSAPRRVGRGGQGSLRRPGTELSGAVTDVHDLFRVSRAR